MDEIVFAKGFQSPDGDFVYSDEVPWSVRYASKEMFQSPDGDFVYSDMK